MNISLYSFEYYFKIAFFPVFQPLKNIFTTKKSVLILRSQCTLNGGKLIVSYFIENKGFSNHDFLF